MASVDETKAHEEMVRELRATIDRAVEANGGSTVALKPAHRLPFHWPPHPVSYSYHVLASDWKGRATFEAYGDAFEVDVAKTPHGVFGRCDELWHEERGETLEQMLQRLSETSEPLLSRQLQINRALEKPGRYKGHLRSLPPIDLIKLLYCENRDVANESRTEIEKHASSRVFFNSLIEIVNDRRHPNRRSAQWYVLDIFEDLPSFATTPDDEEEAVDAMRNLIWDAEDDYARTIYKAGVVLGGHIPYHYGGPTLLECLKAPSRIGRRSAIHGLFHVVEWIPDMRGQVVAALRDCAAAEPEPQLKEFATLMADDIANSSNDHVQEPIFADEP